MKKKLFSKIKLRTRISGGLIMVLLPIAILGLIKVAFVIGAPPVASAIWKFDEGSGTTINDASNNSNTGTASSTVWKGKNDCVSENCLFFTGSSSYVAIADDADFDFTNSDSFTFSVWVRYGSSANGTIILDKNGAAGGIYRIQIESDGDITCGIDDDTTYGPEDSVTSTAATYDDNQWHHVACVKSGGSSLTLYIDGQSVGTPDSSFTATGTLANNGGFTLGGNILNLGTGTDFLGFMDEFRMYRQALTATEIKTEYNLSSAIRFAPRPKDALSDGLVGWWKMDESAANSCTGGTNDSCDSSGNNKDAAWANNTASTTTAKYGRGVDFDGTDDSAAVTDNDIYSVNTTNQLTVSAWMNPDANSGARNVISKGNTSNFEWSLGSNGTQTQALLWNSSGSIIGQATASSTFSTGVWQHFVMTIDLGSNTINLYKNGSLVGTGTISGTYTNGTANLRFGERADGSNDYDGKIDDVRIYNKILSPADVKALYTLAPAPVGYWKFDEGNGTTLQDSSGNNNTATITDGGTVGGWVTGKYGSAYYSAGHTSGDYMTLGGLIDLGTHNTLSFWVNFGVFDDGVNGSVVGGYSTDAAAGYMLYIDSTTIYSRQATGSAVSISNTLSLGTWYHISVVRDGTSVKFYSNGQQLGTTQTLGADNAFSMLAIMNMGTGTQAYPVEGVLDDVRVYNYARTPQQILEDMNGGHPAGGSPIGSEAVLWHFDEGNGTTANDSATATTTNGTLTSMASPATSTSGWNISGKYNAALTFDGSDDKVVIATASDDEVDYNGSEPFSACAWTYVTTMPGSSEMDAIITKWDATTPTRGYRLVVTNDDADSTGNFRAEVYDESADQTLSAAAANDTVAANTWYHVCMTFNGGTAGDAGDLKLYVDTSNVASSSANGSFAGLEDVTADFTVGDYDATDAVAADTAFTGRIDDVEIFSGVLTSDQIAVVRNANSGTNFFTGSDEYSQSAAGSTTTGPVDSWKFDEVSQQTIADNGSNNLACTLGKSSASASDDPTTTDGKIGKALSFDGSNDVVDCDDVSALDFADGTSITVMAWIYRTSVSNDGVILGKKTSNGTNTAGFLLYQWSSGNGGNTCFYVGDGGGANHQIERCTNDNVTITTGQWVHIAAVFDDASALNSTIYLNGLNARHVPYDAGTIGLVGSLSNSANFHIGAEPQGVDGTPIAPFAGKIDQVKIYNYALTAAQINYEMNRDKPYGYWKLDDCTGSTANDSSIKAAGGGSNGVSGTLTIGASGTNTTTGTCTVTNTAAAWYNGASGKYQYGLDFDGTDDFVSVGDNTAMDFGTSRGGSSGTETTQDFSISMWINRRSFTSDDTIVSNSSSQVAANGGYVVWIDDANDDINFALKDGTDLFSINGATAITESGWHHVVVVFDEDSATNSTIYLDGRPDKESTTGTITNVGLMDGGSFRLGAESDGGEPFDGQMDEVQFFPYALSYTQVLKLYNQDSGARFGPATGTP